MPEPATAPGRLTPQALAIGTAHLRRGDPRLGAVIARVGACQLAPWRQIYRSSIS